MATDTLNRQHFASAETEIRVGMLHGDLSPFNKIWHHALSRFNMASEVGEDGVVLSNGTLLAVGLSANLPNHCSGFFGGGLVFDLTASGDIVIIPALFRIHLAGS